MFWGSTRTGALVTGQVRWHAEIRGDWLYLRLSGQPDVAAHLLQIQSVDVSPGRLWARCRIAILDESGRVEHDLGGIPQASALEMQRTIAVRGWEARTNFVAANTHQLESWLERALASLVPASGRYAKTSGLESALAGTDPPPTPGNLPWDSLLRHDLVADLAYRIESYNRSQFDLAYEQWKRSVRKFLATNRWIPKRAVFTVLEKYPPPAIPYRAWETTDGDVRPNFAVLRWIEEHNSEYLSHQKIAQKAFFETVEKNPLTDEQIHACICMDDAVMVVAAAGSGKTATMVAKAGYVIHERLVAPEQILLLAFNRSAANEIGGRIAAQLGGIPGTDQIRSSTFHAFGIEVIAEATGKKPALAPWVDPDKPGEDFREIECIIQTLASRDADFRRNYDLFRLVYGRDIGRYGEHPAPEASKGGRRGFQTANDDIVASPEERVIADWLFYHGMTYEYRPPSEDCTTGPMAHHRPNFSLPDIGIYHRHVVSDRSDPTHGFTGNLQAWESIWDCQANQYVDFVETTSNTLRSGEWVKVYEATLRRRGIEPALDPARPAVGLPPVSDGEMARSFRVFQRHLKNNRLTRHQLHHRLDEQSREGFAIRLQLFLGLYGRVADEWESRLRNGNYIDFEDMLTQAANHVESGAYKSPYAIIMADEYQDCSQARVRLLKALANNPELQTHLCVVGDDWQGINRFAGSDISVMTEFERSFDHTTRLALTTTFRFPQSLCDVSSQFIRANPAQIKKSVRSANPLSGQSIFALGFGDQDAIPGHLEKTLANLHRSVAQVPSRGARIAVLLLGRYGSDKPETVKEWQQRFGDRLAIDYRTIHAAKGLEADYVVVLNLIQGPRGFPSQIQDDPALQLAMPEPEPFRFAEERRLFYVAMTRAKRQVHLYTDLASPSQLLIELASANLVQIAPVGGKPITPCPQCGLGILQRREGKRGSFLGCTQFPACDYTRAASHSPTRGSLQTERAIRFPPGVRADDPCPACGHGVVQQKMGRKGPFLGCSRYREGCRATGSVR